MQARDYQLNILESCKKHNCLVVLPTGLGKTLIAQMLTKYRLRLFPNSKILFLAPTKPLLDQHKTSFEKDGLNGIVFSGEVKPGERAKLWNDNQIIFSTPQTIENDIYSGMSLKNVSLLIIDETHKAVGEYAYTFVAKAYNKTADFPKILGLTASPGDAKEKIVEIMRTIGYDKIEIRTEDDNDVIPYVQDVKVNYEYVDLPKSYLLIKKNIELVINNRIEKLREIGVMLPNLQRKTLLTLQAQLQKESSKGDQDYKFYMTVSFLAEILKLAHAIELLESQGLEQFYNYIKGLINNAKLVPTKALKRLVGDENFIQAFNDSEKIYEIAKHPKLEKLKEILNDETEGQTIVFTQFRDTAKIVFRETKNSRIFIGQSNKKVKGLTQKQQKQLIEEFREGKFKTLIATSVAEEGIDIPSVKRIIFYEPIPSAIRWIQRKGRTGRNDSGEVIVLVSRNTRDEAYRWSAHHKQKKMRSSIQSIKKSAFSFQLDLQLNKEKESESKDAQSQIQITEKEIGNIEQNLFDKILIDHREKGSRVLKELIANGISIELKQLDVGDYLVSDRCCIEYKTAEDFLQSIIDGRLLQQAKSLSENYPKPIILVEGKDLYSLRNIHPNAIRGMIAALIMNFSIPVLFSDDYKDSAQIIRIIHEREKNPIINFQLHNLKKTKTITASQEYLVSSLPDIGTLTAQKLLEHFKSPLKLFNSSEDELLEVPGVGKITVKKIKEILEKTYKS